MTRTLVVHTGGIGDFLLTCPSLARLARDTRLDLLGRPERLALAVAGGIAEAAHDIESSGFESVFSSPNDRLKNFLAGYDAAILWMRDDDGRITGCLRECGLSAAAHPGLPPDDWACHASAYYWQRLGFPGEPAPFRLRLEPDAPGPRIVIHPGSGGARKQWPLHHFIALAERLEAMGQSVAWCLGPAEEGLSLPAGSKRIDSASLVGLAEQLAGASLYIGNDSGITHLAAAAGCPVVAIFGPTDPAVWAPKGPNVTVLQAEPWPTPESVARAAESALTHTRLL